MLDIYEHMINLIRAGQNGLIVTVTEASGSVPRHSGSKMIILPDRTIFGTIGGGKLEKEVIDDAVQQMNDEKIFKKKYKLTEDKGMLCGGNVEVLFEPFGQIDRMIVFGAGHIGSALCPLAKKAGFHVTIVDNRQEFANHQRFPDADEIVVDEYHQSYTKLHFSQKTFIVIITHGHEHDAEIVEHCIQQPFFYLGMIGSKKKTGTVLTRLETKGISKERLITVRTPIGLHIGAETPFEIAISILAEMIAIRQKISVDSLSMKFK